MRLLCRNLRTCHAKNTLNLKKWSKTLVFQQFSASKSLSRHSVVQILATGTSKNAPIMPVFNNFDFQIALAPRRGANFGDFNFKKPSDPLNFYRFDFQIALAPQRGANFAKLNFKKSSGPLNFNDFGFQTALWPQRGANFGDALGSRSSAPARF